MSVTETEKALQKSVVDQILGQSSETAARQEEGVRVDPKSLFSGQQFLFLAQAEEKSRALTTDTSQEDQLIVEHTGTVVGELKEEVCSRFFFHWSNPVLANRLDQSYHSSRPREKLEEGWPDKRATMKRFLRQSHRHAVRGARHRTYYTVT